jgi:hypothetical protein
MALKSNKFARTLSGATAVAAALSLLATPVAARDRWHHRHHDNDIDAGDVVAGGVLLGAIAAIAGAAKNSRDRETYRYPPPEPAPDGYRGVDTSGYQAPREDGQFGSRGIDRAVDLCVGQLELGNSRVASVDSAIRTADGWRVEGVLENNAGYSCSVGNDGRLSDVRVGDSDTPYEPRAEGQYDDEYYTSARASQDTDDGRYDVSETPDFEQ